MAVLLEYESRIRGAQHLAYPPVVAGGLRTGILNYSDNRQIIKNNEMVLVDAGNSVVIISFSFMHAYIRYTAKCHN